MGEQALVVVDMQNGFCKPGGLIYVEQAQRQIPAIAHALAHARSTGMHVVYTQVCWREEDDVVAGLRANIPPLVTRWSEEGGFRPGAWGHRIVDELAPTDADHLVEKRAFDPPGLGTLLHELGVDEVHVVGTTANNCVYAACLAAFEAGLQVRAIADCVSSFSEDFREPWLRNIDTYLGSVVTLEQFAARTPAG